MTGIGRSRLSSGAMAIEIVIKSVNHRGWDIKYLLPSKLSFLEKDMGALIGDKLCRGRIEVLANIETLASDSEVVFDDKRVEDLLVKLVRLQEKFPKIAMRMSVGDLISLPGMLRELDPSIAEEDLKTLSLKALEEALMDLGASRAKEGALLTKSLGEMLMTCRALLKAIEGATDSDVGKRFDRLKLRIDELFGEHRLVEDRLYQEAALLAERADFKEELDRLVVHVEHFDLICQKPLSKGRKLDFLCQEMLRESNTLLSKAFDHHTVLKGIDLKVEIERIREQVQNIE
jgi:uncharacterized protein (TIGR00255 family)